MKELTIFDAEEMAEIDSDAYYTALEALERGEIAARAKGINRAEMARRISMDRGTVTKILNGSYRNITLKTLFALMKAMNRKVILSSIDIDDLKYSRPNFSFDWSSTAIAPSTTYLQSSKPLTSTSTYVRA